MKNLIICLVLSCSFFIGNTSALAIELDGGTILTVIAPKTGQTLCTFELPKGYQPKNSMTKITVTQGKGIIVYTETSKDLTISLPSNLSGTLHVTVEIDGFIFSQKIKL